MGLFVRGCDYYALRKMAGTPTGFPTHYPTLLVFDFEVGSMSTPHISSVVASGLVVSTTFLF